jgi:hypothetical protein
VRPRRRSGSYPGRAVALSFAAPATLHSLIDAVLVHHETDKLEQLLKRGYQPDHDNLEILVNAGSAAAHRGWRPTLTVMSILETFIYLKFVLENQAKQLKAAIPECQKRPKN